MHRRLAITALLFALGFVPIVLWGAFLWDVWPKSLSGPSSRGLEKVIVFLFVGPVVLLLLPIPAGGLMITIGGMMFFRGERSWRLVTTLGLTAVAVWSICSVVIWWHWIGSLAETHREAKVIYGSVWLTAAMSFACLIIPLRRIDPARR